MTLMLYSGRQKPRAAAALADLNSFIAPMLRCMGSREAVLPLGNADCEFASLDRVFGIAVSGLERSAFELCLALCGCLALKGISTRLHRLLGRPRRGTGSWLGRRAGGLE